MLLVASHTSNTSRVGQLEAKALLVWIRRIGRLAAIDTQFCLGQSLKGFDQQMDAFHRVNNANIAENEGPRASVFVRNTGFRSRLNRVGLQTTLVKQNFFRRYPERHKLLAQKARRSQKQRNRLTQRPNMGHTSLNLLLSRKRNGLRAGAFAVPTPRLFSEPGLLTQEGFQPAVQGRRLCVEQMVEALGATGVGLTGTDR